MVRDAAAPGSAVRRPLGRLRRGSARGYRRATASRRMLPTILIIGAQKGGTTSLHEYLAEHPDVGPSAIKEIQYFSNNSFRSLTWYRAHFPREGVFPHALESSPYYLFHPCAPVRVRAVLPDIKLIVLLRDPVERAHSHHNMERAEGREPLDFPTAVAREDQRLAGEEERLRSDPGYLSFAYQNQSYVARGMYAKQLERWYEHFRREQILVLASDDLFADPEGTLHRVQDWLGLSHHAPATLAPRGVRVYGSSIDAGLRAELRGRFAPDSARLPELTGLELPWGSAVG
jgi:hypothetical protein